MQSFPQEQLAAIALGSNLGNSNAILTGAIADLKRHPDITILKISPWYHTKPIGPPQPDYINGCLLAHYPHQAQSLLKALLDIEQTYGRERTLRWGPRTLDLDLILFGSTTLNTEFLTLPHPRMHERRFVLEPLADIYPDWQHPRLNQSVRQLLDHIKSSKSHSSH